MAGNFYYLAAYTAAVAAGFSVKDSREVARAACYADSYTAEEMPAGSQAGLPPGMLSALSYLPDDPGRISAAANPEALSAASADPELPCALFLLCGTDEKLLGHAVEWARKRWQSNEAYTAIWQSAGIALHALGSAFLHQGFSGIANKTVNAATAVMTARPVSPKRMRELLRQSASQPAEALFEWMPYVPEHAPDSFAGCGQLGKLPASPGRIYSYQSPWRTVAAVFCVNPYRYADAYLAMKEALLCIRGEHENFKCPDALSQSEERIELACFFADVPSDEELRDAWRRHFTWCRLFPEDYMAPAYDTERSYANNFGIQALAFRDHIWSLCQTLYKSGLPAEPASQKRGG